MKLHKILLPCLLLTIIALVGIFVLPTPARAAADGYYTYEISNGKATITDCDTAISGAVTIPATLGGCPVTAIGERAFWGCESLSAITIPDSVTAIGNNAFNGCESLTSVYTTNLTAWLKISFGGYCANPLQYARGTLYVNGVPLTHAEIPAGFTKVPNYAFAGCGSLTAITIPNSVTAIGESAFTSCSRLKSVTLPDSVTYLDIYAFYGCSGLASVTLSNNLPYIGGSAFAQCSGLTAVTIPDGVTRIGDSAFRYCYNLKLVTIPVSVTYIGTLAFNECNDLRTVCYSGSQGQWKKITFQASCGLASATVLYNHVHDYTSIPPVSVPATCTENGYIEYTCTNGHTDRQTLFALGHKAAAVVQVVPPTCTKEGYTIYGCSRCDGRVNGDFTEKLGHDITVTQSVVPPTCTKEGYTIYGCSRCDITEKRDFTEKTDHKPIPIPAVAPTCTIRGLSEGARCEQCGRVVQAQSVIPAPGHQYAAGVCTVCGEDQNQDFTGDGELTDADAVYLLRYTLFPEDYPLFGNLDINADGVITDADAVYLLRHTLFPKDYPLFPQKEH